MRKSDGIDMNIAGLHIYTSKAMVEPSVTGTPRLGQEVWTCNPCKKDYRMVKYYIYERTRITLSDILVEYEQIPLHLVAHLGIRLVDIYRNGHSGGMAPVQRLLG